MAQLTLRQLGFIRSIAEEAYAHITHPRMLLNLWRAGNSDLTDDQLAIIVAYQRGTTPAEVRRSIDEQVTELLSHE